MKAQTIERILGIAGLVLLGVWICARLDRVVFSHLAIDNIQRSNPGWTSGDLAISRTASEPPIDFRQWSMQRIEAYEYSLASKCDKPVAVLQIPKIRLEAPVFATTNDLTLNRGLGIIGPSVLGRNIGIAGHRDGFFRGLQYVEPGDLIKLVWPGRVDVFRVTEIRIVSPDDVSVLDPTSRPEITLVTCFPFYFIGHAPRRYVVTAQMQQSHPECGATENSSSKQ